MPKQGLHREGAAPKYMVRRLRDIPDVLVPQPYNNEKRGIASTPWAGEFLIKAQTFKFAAIIISILLIIAG